MKKDATNQSLTPMMEQFFRLKKENPGFILFFRMGDFYEMFDEDAKIASRILGLNLTKRQQFDMCGIPHHAKDNYLYKLIQSNYKVAICEQVEIPGNNKKMFDRRVMELLTPGTFHSDQLSKKEQNLFLMSLYKEKNIYYFSLVDVATGELLVGESLSVNNLRSQIYKFSPSEIIIDLTQEKELSEILSERYYSLIEHSQFLYPEENFLKKQFQVESMTAIGLENPFLQSVVFTALKYLQNNLFKDIKHINTLNRIQSNSVMYLSEITIKNLEILESSGDSEKRKYSLLSHLNITKTVMGTRYLRHLLIHPSTNLTVIEERLEYISSFLKVPSALEKIRSILSFIPDCERLLSKISLKTASPKDVWNFKNGLSFIEELKQELPDGFQNFSFSKKDDISLAKIIEKVQGTLLENPPIDIGDEPVIQDAYSEELATLRKKALQSYQVLIDIEKQEQEKNNLPRLRIKYNKILGYYIEIPKGAAAKVPDYFIRKQTLSNLERFTIETLINFEQEVLTAKENLVNLEKQIFSLLCEKLMEYIQVIQQNIELVKSIDVFSSFAQLAKEYNYTRPSFVKDQTLEIVEGRHPVVEKYAQIFTPNSLLLNDSDSRLWLISGPNMAGKSTFLRQSAIIVLMAHIGCYVPASSARIPIVDQIFTRIGASDNLAKGESTFLVEMAEASSILNFTTPKSLIIMDEIGRGTSTNDGLSLACAIVEYLCDPNINRGKILFATHYHELAQLETKYTGIKNYRMAVKETDKNIVFLHKIEYGSADRSYGIHVAAIAGLPRSIIKRAGEYLAELDKPETNLPKEKTPTTPAVETNSNTKHNQLAKQILKIDINRITGMDALNILSSMQKGLKSGSKPPSTDNTGILF